MTVKEVTHDYALRVHESSSALAINVEVTDNDVATHVVLSADTDPLSIPVNAVTGFFTGGVPANALLDHSGEALTDHNDAYLQDHT